MKTKLDLQNIDWSLYSILDKEFVNARSLEYLAEELIKGGVGLIQLRNKISKTEEFYLDALKVKEVTQKYGIPLIINDRLDIAMAVKAEGVHLGPQDLPLKAAQRLVRGKMIIGASVHNIDEFHAARAGGVDYVGVGTIYPTKTKIETNITGIKIIKILRQKTNLPMVAIGGITIDNLEPVIRAGADGVAVISALLEFEDVRKRAEAFVHKVKQVKLSLKKSHNKYKVI